MFIQIIIILICISLILLLYYLYQIKLDNSMNYFKNIPYPSNEYANAVGKYCPEGYNYMGIDTTNTIAMDKCDNIYNPSDTLKFTTFTSDEWPTKNDDPGLIKRCKYQETNNLLWPSLSNACYNVKE